MWKVHKYNETDDEVEGNNKEGHGGDDSVVCDGEYYWDDHGHDDRPCFFFNLFEFKELTD